MNGEELAEKATRLHTLLDPDRLGRVAVGVGADEIHVYAFHGFAGEVPETFENVKIEAHRNCSRPTAGPAL